MRILEIPFLSLQSFQSIPSAEIAQSVEHDFPKVRVAGSIPVFRSIKLHNIWKQSFMNQTLRSL